MQFRIFIIALLICLSGATGAGAGTVQISDIGGWKIYQPGNYRYGASIIMNSDNSMDVWFASPGASGQWDWIRYRRSTDGGKTWSTEQVALKPTAGSRDAYSVCDPGVIYYGGYYYVGYTSTENANGVENHVYVARSTSPTGPFEKWNGSGWGGNPQPIITYTGPAGAWGCGEPSFVLKDGKLYMYYTYNDGTTYTNLAICDNPNAADWPANLRMLGHVIVRPLDDSTDVKYVDSLGMFIGVSTHNRFTVNSRISVWQSVDGISWQKGAFTGSVVQCGAHNVGISANETGHLDTSKSNCIIYSCQPPGYSWGYWPTYLDTIKFGTVPAGGASGAEVSSVVDASSGDDWYSSGPRVCDGDVSTVWCSDKHTSAFAAEWVSLSLPALCSISHLVVVPASNGDGFPVAFRIQYSTDGNTWLNIAGQSYSNYLNPGNNPVLFTFSSPVTTKYIRIYATQLAGNSTDGYYMKFAEVTTADPAAAWEFDTTGDTEGWSATHSVANMTSSGGCLVGDVSGDDPYIDGPRYPDIDASANKYICIRMKISSGTSAEFFWGTADEPWHKAGREVSFPIIADNQFHDYEIDMSTNAQWTGIVNCLRLDPSDQAAGHFEVDYIRVCSTARPVLELSGPSATNRYLRVGEAAEVSVCVRNTGYSTATNLRPTLSVDGLALSTPVPASVASLAPGVETKFVWQVQMQTEGLHKLAVSLASDDPAGTVSSSSTMFVSCASPNISADAPSQAQSWLDASGNAVIENSKLRMVFPKSNVGYGVCEFYVRNGSKWDLMGESCPLSRVKYSINDSEVDLALLPGSASVSKANSEATLRFSNNCPDSNGGYWRGYILFRLSDNGDTIRANYSLYCTASRQLLAWVGPSLCAGSHSFGQAKSQAIFPGLEWLVGDERSSNTLECDSSLALRLVPHPYKVTVPLMAVSANGSVAGILWNARSKWNGTDAYPSARFCSPNWYESQDNSLMELFVPTIPKWLTENQNEASAPYVLNANNALIMECYYFGSAGSGVLDAVAKWYDIYGTPAMPGDVNLLSSGLLTARQGFMSTIWNADAQGWPHAVGWDSAPCPEFAADLFADALTESDPTIKAALRSRADEAVQKAIALWGTGGLASWTGSHIPGYRLPYFAGHLDELAAQMNTGAGNMRASQQSDGSWLVPVNSERPDLVTAGTAELGSCAENAYFLLRHARLTGNYYSRSAGLKALAYMNTFIVPRAAQVWEVPQHAPDILASAWAVAAYLEGYLIGDTNAQSYLDKARYWAMSGLPFVYTWKAYDRDVMDYATIPVFGCTFFVGSWFGKPVQWCGMVYAYYLERLSHYDDSMNWHAIAEGITRSCIQQMNISPYVGTYGDSLNLLYSNTPNGVFINPDNVYKCASRLLGRWGEVDTRKIVGSGRTAYISSCGRIIIGSCSASSSQLTFKVEYPAAETCNILLYCGIPVSVYKGGKAIPKVADVDSADEGWMYDSTLGCTVIKEKQDSDLQEISVVFSGSYAPVVDVGGPQGARNQPDGTMVLLRGVVSSGSDAFYNIIYVQSEDRTSGIRVSLPAKPAVPISEGDCVEVMGCLAKTSGERYVARADVIPASSIQQ